MMGSHHLIIHDMLMYVDVFFAVFNSHNEAKELFSYLNSGHPHIKFTLETKINKVIPFFGCPYW